MAGYDGHRGCINYFAVHPDFQTRGFGKQLMDYVGTDYVNWDAQK